jgi:hypothetical protein
MKSAQGLAKIPVIVTLLVLAAGGATFQTRHPATVEESTVTVETAAPEGEVPYIGEMTVTASRTN